MHQYLGNIHIHSTHSDGHSSIVEIARAAATAGLDFIIITDHNTLAGQAEEGYHHGVLVLVGSEINKAKNHYLALNIKNVPPVNDGDPQQVIDNVNSQNGLGFIAHPFELGSRLVHNYQHFPWTDWDVTGYTGIEVWNWCSQWRDGAKNAITALYHAYLDPAGLVKGPDPTALARFDEITKKRRTVAITGSDAHAWPIRRGPLRRTIFPYTYQFRTANNCLLLEQALSPDFPTAKAQIYEALQNGRLFMVNNLLGDPTGFSFSAFTDGSKHHPGDEAPLGELTTLQIDCPQKKRGRLRHRIIHNGRLHDEIDSGNASVRIHNPGAYRLEVYRNNKPWIFTNPIYIT